MHFSTLTSFCILFFFLFIYHIAAKTLAIETLQDDGDDDICKKIDCGQGKCVPSNTSFLGIKGFDCICNPGWQKMQLGPITLPACSIPNCTVDFQCGNGGPPQPPPPSPLGLFTPCTFVWCGDGSCVINGTGYYCKCNEGSANFLGLPGVACFKQCALGGDCKGVSLGPLVTPPPPPSGNPSGSPASTPPPSADGASHVPNCARSFGQVTMSLFSLVVLQASV